MQGVHSLHRSGRRCLAGHYIAPTVPAVSGDVIFHVSSKPASRTLVTVRMGRNDGNSGGRKRRWYPTGPGLGSGGGSGTTTADTVEEGRSRDRYRDEGRRQGGPRWARPQDGGAEDGGDDERGWWERPEEASLEAYAPKALEPWQEERLEQAYCIGRRKVQMQQLSAELSLDRAVVVDWFKRFALRPEEEQRAILTARRAELAKKKVEEEAFLKEEEERRRQSHQTASASGGQAARRSPTDRTAAPAGGDDWLSSSAEPQPQGFVPFYQRKEAGLVGRKRLPADALRSLEAVYYRTPFPSKEMIQGLFDLHRLTRDTVLDWFVERRKVDGIVSSTQRRVGKRDLDKDLAWDEDDEEDGSSLGSDDGRRGGSGRRGGRDPQPSSKDADMLRALGGDATRGPGPGEPQTMQVFSMSKREMAQLRSAMPSPRKRTGQQMAEKMQLKTGADQPQTQIYDLQFVEDTTKHEDKWARSWRYKGSTRPAGAATGHRVALAGSTARRQARGAGSGKKSDADASLED